jgi:hypothetical protein
MASLSDISFAHISGKDIKSINGSQKSCPSINIVIPGEKGVLPSIVLKDAKQSNKLVAVRPSRLQKLQELEAKLPVLVKEEVDKQKKEKLDKLHQKDKENPNAVKERVKKYAEKNREAINERRREKRKSKTTDTNEKNSSKSSGAVVEF